MELKQTFERAVEASRALALLDGEKINEVLLALADETERQSAAILEENARDLAAKDPSDPMYDRLMLTPARIKGIADDIRHVAALRSPVGEEMARWTRPNGMEIVKVRVPFGVVGVIYEARPNVSFDVFSLCFKTSNACILKGGSDAVHSNAMIISIIKKVLYRCGVPQDAVTLLPNDREAPARLLTATDYVDLLIPRGSASLIRYVRDNAHVPVIETGAGVCHTYFSADGDVKKGAAVIFNAKTRRVSVCNALDCLIVHVWPICRLCAPRWPRRTCSSRPIRVRTWLWRASIPRICSWRQMSIVSGRSFRTISWPSKRWTAWRRLWTTLRSIRRGTARPS